MRAWYMHDCWSGVLDGGDQHAENRSSDAEVPLRDLVALGLDCAYIDPFDYRIALDEYKEKHGYNYEDQCIVSPIHLPNYEQKVRDFFEEHLHTDDEVRYCRLGSGYFDVRDMQNRWIRVQVTRGDLLIVPAGIWHRFTTDDKDFIVACRLFKGEPVWTPHNRSDVGENHPAHQQYIKARAGPV